MWKNKSNTMGASANCSWKLAILLLLSFISLSPIITIIACNKKDHVEQNSDNNRVVELLNQIKTKINTKFEQKLPSVLDHSSFTGLSENDLFRILAEYYVKMSNTDSIEIDNQQIIQHFINQINEKLIIMNNALKSEVAQLSNLPFDVVSINVTKLFLEKLSYNQIINVIKNLDQSTNYNIAEEPPKIFKLNLSLSFKIKIDNIREEEYVFSGIYHFITDNAKDIFSKLTTISNFLYSKLQSANISLENILNDQGDLVGNLNQKFIGAIQANFSKNNSELNLSFDKLWTANPIKIDDLRVTLNSLKHTKNGGVDADDELVKYYKEFIQILLKSRANIIKTLYTDNKMLKNANEGSLPNSGQIKIKNFSYIPLNLSINGINIPMVKPINTFLIIEYENLVKYLVQFGDFLDEYFTLIKAGDVAFSYSNSRKVVTIKKESLNNVWGTVPVKGLEVDFKQTIFSKMKNINKQYFKMNFNGAGRAKNLDDGVHWNNVTVTFIFKIFTIKFLDDEQIKFKYE